MATRFHTPGSIWIELALWIIFFPAGIIYSLWRWTSRRPVVEDKTCDAYHTFNGMPPIDAREGSLWYDHDRTGEVNGIYHMRSGAWQRLGQ